MTVKRRECSTFMDVLVLGQKVALCVCLTLPILKYLIKNSF